MRIIRNFTKYQPTEEAVRRFGLPNAFFIKSEDGQCWYDVQNSFSPDTWKILIDDQGIIVQLVKNIEMSFPVDMTVVELDELPEGFNENTRRDWELVKTKLIKRKVTPEQLDEQRNSLIRNTMTELSVLLAMGDLLDKAESARAEKLKGYVAALKRLDVTVKKVVFPKAP
ncbi:tail fiber assembly protein [Burkholderia pseudomallei]|jgi:hypothetical protein|uniref:tail fiber assembly protein n=1 Tax=Burkholderia pseudomallei TaxID=28450 RepID=UPI0024DFA607|nr:tail fiber assembly protein [Burkholderia pseudomallei]